MSGCNRESSVRRAVRADGVNLDTGEIEAFEGEAVYEGSMRY